MPEKIEAFNFFPGRIIAGKYSILTKLGGGWEGEVYRVIEKGTRIERAAKFFFPARNPGGKASRLYARKLHRLRDCALPIQYHTEESITFRRTPITVLISEYVEGDILGEFLSRQPGRRVRPFEGLHLLHALAKGMAEIHQAGEYHGDLHPGNVIVRRSGLSFELKLLDLFHLDDSKAENRRTDVLDSIRIFYDALGGQRLYARQPTAVKEIVCGLKHTLILKKYPTMNRLVKHLENMTW
ncbi:protein kinase [bacterium]|nr:protein kinase [bacterium]